MFLCHYEDRITVIDGKLCRIVNATAKRKGYEHLTLDVYREFEDETAECRNLYYSMCGGYRVAFPGTKNAYYQIESEEDFGSCKPINCFNCHTLTYTDKQLIASLYPDFIYTLNKWDATSGQVFEALRFWKDHKEIEFMLAAGMERIALTKAFWKCSENKRKQIVDFLRKSDKRALNLPLSDIQKMINAKVDYKEYKRYKDFFLSGKISYQAFRFLEKHNQLSYNGVALYCDYRKLLYRSGHKKDNYWLYPKDLQKKHDELFEEVCRKEALRKADQLQKKQGDYIKAVKKYLKSYKEIDGYSVYVPNNVLDINYQAEYLHQCLITCDYIEKVIQKHCVLVFIRKDEKPVATVELLPRKKIGQFYANELDRKNCLPTEEVREVFNKWLMAA